MSGEVSEWTETGTATDDVASATRAAEVGMAHYVTTIAGSFSAAAVGVLTFEGAVYDVHNQREVVLERPVRIAAGEAAVLELAAGGGGVVGAVTMTGFTRRA